MDEPTAALGIKGSRCLLDLIRDVRDGGLPIISISHNMPHVWGNLNGRSWTPL